MTHRADVATTMATMTARRVMGICHEGNLEESLVSFGKVRNLLASDVIIEAIFIRRFTETSHPLLAEFHRFFLVRVPFCQLCRCRLCRLERLPVADLLQRLVTESTETIFRCASEADSRRSADYEATIPSRSNSSIT